MTIDIAIMGDSLTVDRNARNWPFLLEKILQTGRSQKVRTCTFGREGQSSNWGLANLSPVLKQKPQIAMIGFINDANPGAISLATSASNTVAMIDQIQTASPSTAIYLVTVAKPTDAAAGSIFPNLAALDAQLSSIASTQGVGFINCRAVWGAPIASEYDPSDNIHPLLPAYLRVTIPVIASALGPLVD